MNANPFSLAGRTILVTGASSGIGRQCCISIAQMGGRVIATGRNRERLAATGTAMSGEGHRLIAADLLNGEGMARIASEPGELNGVVHAAGITARVPVRYLTEALLRDTHRLNFEAPLLLTRDLFKSRKLLPGASIVFVASVAPLLGMTGLAAYASSKGALMAAARVIAKEFAVRGIRANCLCPGTVSTPMIDGLDASQKERERDEKSHPLGHGRPEDVAHAAVFLLSDASRWVTGTSIVLDGGLLL